MKSWTKVVGARGFGLDRFDAQGRSRSYVPIALPFPTTFHDED